jgi:hypothetical protein
MMRALAPWIIPLALVLGVLMAAVNSTLLDLVGFLVLFFVAIPVVLATARRRGTLPPMLERLMQRGGGDGGGGRPRWLGF